MTTHECFDVFRSEYLMFQKITKLEYEFPSGFCDKARDLVEKLLVSYLISLKSTGILKCCSCNFGSGLS